MSLSISISPEAESRLQSRASAVGEDLPSFVAKLVSQFADAPTSLEELSGPIHQNFIDSGLTDDELTEILEIAKHELRAKRRQKSQQ